MRIRRLLALPLTINPVTRFRFRYRLDANTTATLRSRRRFSMNCRLFNCPNIARLPLAALFSLCIATSTALAQGKPAGAGPPPNNNPNIGDRIRQIDEGRLRGAETNASLEEENKKRVEA